VYYQYFDVSINHSMVNILNSIKSFFEAKSSKDDLSSDQKDQLNQAIICLLTEMVKADYVELYIEKLVLNEHLTKRLNLSRAKANKYLAHANISAQVSVTLKPQTEIINNYLNRQDKHALMVQLWQIASADGEIHLLETQTFYQAGEQLGFSKGHLDRICHPEKAIN